MPVLLHGDGRYLRSPHLVDEGEAVHLYAIAWSGQTEALVRFVLDDAGQAHEPEVIEERDAILGLSASGSAAPRVVDSLDALERREVDGAAAWVHREAGRSEVRVSLRSGREVLVFGAACTIAAPTVLPVEDGGAFVAFHHNLREDTLEADLTKWIALRFVTADGAVKAPAAPMTDRDRDREGEEQGFEFPTLVRGADGAIALFGRGSHAFFRQDLDRDGFSERVALGDTGWGCRGRWVSALTRGDGQLVAARRVKTGIDVSILAPPRGGPPELLDTDVALAARPHRDVPERPTGPDPAARDGRRTLFGDIHQHSAHSDGCGAADEPYLRARYVYGDDFGALTDHESFIGKRIGPGEWKYLCAVTDRHNEPGRFATLNAYEWTGRMYPGPGHKVVYLPAKSGPIVSRDDVPDGRELVERVKSMGGFAVPHHVGWTGADEAAHDPVGQPVWEICSCHGCYEHADHPLGGRGDLRDQMVDAVMRRGHRFGFIACSDGHGLLYHHGVGRKRDPFRCGLTAVQAEDLSREAILRAIRERRCYATSGVPIFLDLRANGAPMGSELTLDGPAQVVAEARCATPIERLSLIGPEGPLATELGAGAKALRVEAEVAAGWVYARVLQADSEMAWSSPIFFDPIRSK